MIQTVYRMRVTLPAPAYEVEVRLADGSGVAATTRLELRSTTLPILLLGIMAIVVSVLAIIGALGLRHRWRRARLWPAKAARP